MAQTSKLAALCSMAVALWMANPAVHAQAQAQAQGQAQAWPSKPIRLIVPYAAGGPGDVIARAVAKKAGEGLQQNTIVDNKGGAGGTIGIDAAMKAAPDGNTFALTAQSPLAGMPNLMKVPYALSDVQYLTLVAHGPAVIVVGKNVAAANVAELIRLAKTAPGKLNYGVIALGSTPQAYKGMMQAEFEKWQRIVTARKIS
jgi:tripartite-type tricarboxylate transporter receptor subunit TctC